MKMVWEEKEKPHLDGATREAVTNEEEEYDEKFNYVINVMMRKPGRI